MEARCRRIPPVNLLHHENIGQNGISSSSETVANATAGVASKRLVSMAADAAVQRLGSVPGNAVGRHARLCSWRPDLTALLWHATDLTNVNELI